GCAYFSTFSDQRIMSTNRQHLRRYIVLLHAWESSEDGRMQRLQGRRPIADRFQHGVPPYR
ncbi:hypothetical protein, partial [Methylobacterium gnaphalii]|uniref:hypothetical protein n=1 Tax=Methylobacterium gnaphalii TaxID=1010610 RepID=UPI001FCF0631